MDKLAADYGKHIDGSNVAGSRKGRFLKDGALYLRTVGKRLQAEYGYGPVKVHSNPGGTAVAGESWGYFTRPDGTVLFVEVGQPYGSHMGKRADGVTVMVQTRHAPNADQIKRARKGQIAQGGIRSGNYWLDASLTAAQLAERLAQIG